MIAISHQSPDSFLFPSCLVGNLFPFAENLAAIFKDPFSILEYLSVQE